MARGIPFSLGQIWAYGASAASRAVNATHIAGTAIAAAVAGYFPADIRYWNGTAVAAPDTAGYAKVTLKSGAGAGELLLTAGKVDVNDKTGFSIAANSPGVIKLIQRGTIVLNGVASNTATITSIDTTKAELRQLGFETDTNDIKTSARITLTNGTTITANRSAAVGSITTVSYEVSERY